MSHPLTAFEDLGESIRSAWRASSFDTDSFPRVAARALEGFDCPDAIAYDEIALAINGRPLAPANHSFSDLSLRVFESKDFFIELLTWLDGTTVIHEHAFSGAYRVLQGDSIHSRFAFTTSKRITRRLTLGRAEFVDAELLARGDVREIHAGPQSMHSLFHLARPSVTLVVRTHGESWWMPQAQIFRPYVAMDHSLLQDTNVQFAAKAIAAFAQHDESKALSLAARFAEDLDLPRAFALCVSFAGHPALYQAAGARLCTRFDDDAPLVRQALAVHGQLERYKQLRRVMHDQHNRFLVALLSTVPSRAAIEALASRHLAAGDVYRLLAALFLEILVQSGYPFRLARDSALEVLSLVLRHRTAAAFADGLRGAFDAASLNAYRNEIQDLRARLTSDVLLQELFE